jgi:hypothetical protein
MNIPSHPLLYQVHVIAISDGSHKNKWGTASWKIMPDTNEDEQWAGLHVTPGRKDDQSAFSCEIGGI